MKQLLSISAICLFAQSLLAASEVSTQHVPRLRGQPSGSEITEHIDFQPLKDTPVSVISGGYSDDMQMPTGFPCLADGKIEYSGGTKSIVQLGNSYSFSDIQKSLNVDISGDASIGIFSADASSSYARYIQDTSYSESFYFMEQIILPTQI